MHTARLLHDVALSPRIAVVLLVACTAAGCSTQRTLTIDSAPSGARIWVNGTLHPQPTPVDVPFTHYGRFDVRLEKEGYRSVATELEIPTQPDGYPVVDLVLEAFAPERRFRRVVPMQPIGAAPTDADVQAALEAARALKERTQREVIEPGTPGRQAPGVLRP